jgi:hypothetical protein
MAVGEVVDAVQWCMRSLLPLHCMSATTTCFESTASEHLAMSGSNSRGSKMPEAHLCMLQRMSTRSWG